MGDKVHVQVPMQFAEELGKARYPKVSRSVFRSVGTDQLFTLVATGAGLAADAATILVAKDTVLDFLEHLRRWITRQAKSNAGSTLVVELTKCSPGEDSHVRMEIRAASTDAIPEVDMRAMAELMSSVLGVELDHDRSKNQDDSA